MRIAYFNCFAGISGDMTLGALVDLGFPVGVLEEELSKLGLRNWRLSENKVLKKGLQGTQIKVETAEEKKHRHLADILNIIEQSSLNLKNKELSKKIFYRLAEAEAKVHGTSLEKVHFHEVGALDSIIDIVGTAIGINYLEIEKVYASEIHVGKGTIRCAHGLLPVPAPATMELLQGVPIYSTEVEGELVTPTGAAILTTLCQQFGSFPSFTVEKTGYGAGEKDFPMANLLSISLGWEEKLIYSHGKAVMLETNIDDMNPQIYQYIFQRLLAAGALDVFLTPVQMKKNRPGVVLHVLSPQEKVNQLTEIIFQETTTLGLRVYPVSRKVLEREIWQIETPYGSVAVKVGRLEQAIVNITPEYEECSKIAEVHGVPLKIVLDLAREEAYKKAKGR